MNVAFTLGALTKTKWYEYLVRFAFGGAITLTARFLAEHFGPMFGGLFLAFPAIFPASATLVAKHETHKKQNAGIETNSRGRQAVAVDAAGAPLGSVGLAAFALTVWKFLPYYNSAFVFLAAKRFGSRWPSSLGAFGENTVAVSHFS
jgi:Protein of unknown function (DUF3147)